MSIYSMLSLDLGHGVTPEKRNMFYDELKKLKWIKINSLTTIWYARWQDSVTEQEIIEITKKHIESAAQYAKVSNIDAAISIGLEPITWRKL